MGSLARKATDTLGTGRRAPAESRRRTKLPKVLVGRTPLTIEDLRADQEHSLALTLHAHEPWERRLSLTSGEARTLEADLERIEGVLEVITHPSGARVEINGRSRGQSPLETPGLFIGEEQEVVLSDLV